MRRHAPTLSRLRPWHWFLIGLVCYLLAAGAFLIEASLPSLQSGLLHAQTGEAALANDPKRAAQELSRASTDFAATVENLRGLPLWVKLLSPLPPFRWQVQLVKASHALSQAGAGAASLASSFPDVRPTEGADLGSTLGRSSVAYFSWFDANQEALRALQAELAEADSQLQSVPSWIPLGRKLTTATLQREASAARHALDVTMEASKSLEAAFGKGSAAPRTFLIVFQNDAELRPTGGFLGSYAVLTASSGAIRSFKFGTDIYKLDAFFKDRAILPAFPPLQTLSYYAGFRDSNVGYGFLNEAAQGMAGTYQRATGTAPDGIAFLDASVLVDLLRITGPVTSPDGSLTLDADTMRASLTQAVEKTYFEDPENRLVNEPKQVIGDLIPILAAKLPAVPDLAGIYLPVLRQELSRKSIQFWFRSEDLARLVAAELPADRPLENANWIKVVNTNLGGLKSSPSVRQEVTITQTEDALNKRLVQDVRIVRTHVGSAEWPDGTNRNLMEIYLPADADITALPDGNGGESQMKPEWREKYGIKNEPWKPQVISGSGWRKASFWATTPVGTTTTYHLTYSLPLTAERQNFLTYLKQAGSSNERLRALGYDGPVETNLTLSR